MNEEDVIDTLAGTRRAAANTWTTT